MNQPLSDRKNSVPPLGDQHDDQRRCARLLGHKDGSEVLCGKPAAVHVIYEWLTERKPDYEHGWACPEHWAEFQQRWSCAGHHAIGPNCGMPGSRVTLDGCHFDDLPTAEPVRAVAEVPVA